MYLVIKEIRGQKEKQIPLRLYQDCLNAYNYVEQYMKDSSGNKWNKELIEPRHICKRFIIKQRWLRELKNGDIECLKVRYMKIYS